MLTRPFSVFQIIPWIESLWPTGKCRGRESFGTWYYIVLSAILFIFFIKIESNCFSKTYSEIERTLSINSSKEEMVLLRDSKKLYVLRFVWVFDQNRKHVEAWNQRTDTLTDFDSTVRSSHWKCSIRQLFLKSVGVCFLKSCRPLVLQLYQKGTPTQVFSCAYCEIFNATNF